MTSQTTLRLDHITLSNFRCFAECEFGLHPSLTVLVAENGRGKTAILDAISLALSLFVDAAAATPPDTIDPSNVRLIPKDEHTMEPELPLEIIADGMIDAQNVHWSRTIKGSSLRARAIARENEGLRRLAQGISFQAAQDLITESENARILPIVAYYGTNRLGRGLSEQHSERFMASRGRIDGYASCLAASSSIQEAINWFGQKMSEVREGSAPYATIELLTAVRQATRVVLNPTGWCELDWDFDHSQLVVEHDTQGRLPFSVLSDGVRNTVALTMDIARRGATLNPHLSEEAARKTPGILLIDEVDMHLHPKWQQRIVGLLQTAFPQMQLVVTTHSPHVLSTVDRESIRIVRHHQGNGYMETPQFQTRGVESADVLAKIMDVDPVPQVEEAQWLSDYRALLQTDRHTSRQGHRLWERLLEHFGEEHPVIQEIETLRRLQDFKRVHNLHQSEDIF